jgi:thymidylate kinase
LAQKNITSFERSNITQYLVFEGLDAIGQSTLLADAKIFLGGTGVGLWVRHCGQGQPLDDLCRDEVLLATAINDEL